MEIEEVKILNEDGVELKVKEEDILPSMQEWYKIEGVTARHYIGSELAEKVLERRRMVKQKKARNRRK
jgi:hypothetical protein